MEAYLNLVKEVLSKGTKKPPAREKMPCTISISGNMLKHNMSNGFPLLTTKQMHLKGIFYELLWFLNGNTNIKYLVDNGVNIWNDDAYRWYQNFINKSNIVNEDYVCLKEKRELTQPEFLQKIKNGQLGTRSDYKLGDMGKIYGHQWRKQNGIDQLEYVINSIKENPYSRYHIIDAWNPKDKSEMGLPPCHLLYQFIGRGEYLDLVMYQRSADLPLGVPYNIASIGLFLMIICNCLNLKPGEITWVGGDVHIYENQIDAMLEQLQRNPRTLPQLYINKKLNSIEDIINLKFEDIELLNYIPHNKIKIQLSTGK